VNSNGPICSLHIRFHELSIEDDSAGRPSKTPGTAEGNVAKPSATKAIDAPKAKQKILSEAPGAKKVGQLKGVGASSARADPKAGILHVMVACKFEVNDLQLLFLEGIAE